MTRCAVLDPADTSIDGPAFSRFCEKVATHTVVLLDCPDGKCPEHGLGPQQCADATGCTGHDLCQACQVACVTRGIVLTSVKPLS